MLAIVSAVQAHLADVFLGDPESVQPPKAKPVSRAKFQCTMPHLPPSHTMIEWRRFQRLVGKQRGT
eukprot:13378105-Alexandrium_andersonii.AAC.1